MNRRGRKTSVLVKMAQDRFYACEVCHSDSNVFLETIFKRCGFTQREMKRAAAQITCPGCESSLNLSDNVEPYPPERLRFDKMLSRDAPRLTDLDQFLRQFPTLPALHATGKELAVAVKKARVTVLAPEKWYRCIGGKKVSVERVFPAQPQRAYRFNHTGQFALYLADDPRTAVVEVLQEDKLKEVRAGLWIADVEINSPLRVLDVRMPMPFIDHKGQPSILQTLLSGSFLREKKKRKDQFQPQYLVTRFVADLVRYRNLDGVYYTSCHEYPFRDDLFGTNLVVFNPNYRSFTTVRTLTAIKWSHSEGDMPLGLPAMLLERIN